MDEMGKRYTVHHLFTGMGSILPSMKQPNVVSFFQAALWGNSPPQALKPLIALPRVLDAYLVALRLSFAKPRAF